LATEQRLYLRSKAGVLVSPTPIRYWPCLAVEKYVSCAPKKRKNMNQSFKNILYCFLFILICFYGCSKFSASDKYRLNEINQKHNNKFVFKIWDDNYLQISVKHGLKCEETEYREFFKEFFLKNDNTERSDTRLIQLNVYDEHWIFLYGLIFDQDKKTIIKTDIEVT
jgi:hypothetical protein